MAFVLTEFQREFEEKLKKHLTPEEDNQLFHAARYAALGEGKRIRPRLCIETGLSLGSTLYDLIDAACSLELIHTSSLIHDDLPCMDDDDYRRGKASLHKVYGEAHALLTGDFLLVYPFEILAKSSLPGDTKCSLIALLSSKIGAEGMILGQHLDLSITKESEPLDLEAMYRHKTADLLEASILSGAIIAGANAAIKENLSHLAQEIGLGYQLYNDLIDSSKLSGRTISSDEKNDKITLTQMLGRNQVERYLEMLSARVLSTIQKMDLKLPVLEEVCEMFLTAAVGKNK